MAIYSLHHSSIGKTTQAKPHTAAAHVRYITRSSAASRVEAQRLPDKPHKIAAFMVEAENADRKNARVADKLMLALPRELNSEQRADLVRGFAEDITRGRAPWLAAFHDKGKDAHNPHVHLLIRDRDPATGKRVAGLSEKGTTQQLRTLWETHANQALEAAGRGERIDSRSLNDQGISREATVHEGPKARQMDRRGARPKSRVRQVRNRPGSHRRHREVDYAAIDAGRSRPDYNRAVLADEGPDEWWEAIHADNQRRELDELRQIHHPPGSVDVALVAGPAVEEAYEGLVNERRALLAGLDKPNVDKKVAHFVGEVAKEPSDLSHGVIYYRLKRGGKGMAGDKRIEKLQEEIAAVEERIVRQDRKFNALLDQSYQDGTLAHTKMNTFLEKHGYQELLATIRTAGSEFGPPPEDPGLRNDAGKHRSELYVALSDSWKLAEQHDELKAHLAGLQAQQSAGSTPGSGSERPSPKAKSAIKPEEAAPKAAPAARLVKASQKSPAEIRAAIATWKASKGQEIGPDVADVGAKPRTPAEMRAAIAARKAKRPSGQGAEQRAALGDEWDVDDF